MNINFVEEMVQTFPKGMENWRMYRIEYGGHAEACLIESVIWLPSNSKISELENLFDKWQQITYEEWKEEFDKQPKHKLIRNRAKCKKCGDIIESKFRHDFVECSCGCIFVDGGLDYMRFGGNEEDFEDMSEWQDE